MKRNPLFALGLSVAIVVGLQAQVSYSDLGSTYTQNFDTQTVLADGATGWVNNETYLGWSAFYHNASLSTYTLPTTATVTTGAGTGFNLYRSTGSLDVALGGQATNGTEMGPYNEGGIFYGLQIANATGSSLTNFTFGYTGEQWRRAGNMDTHRLLVYYSLNATSLDDAAATWIAVPEATFVGPQTSNSATAASLNGNLTANRVVVDGATMTGLSVEQGQSVWLRWFDNNDANSDHGFGIDDVWFTSSATVVPEPSAYAVLAGFVGLAAAVLQRRKARA
ncbi:MAG: hypothetical protein ABW223_04150 [Rariglobus sp.]